MAQGRTTRRGIRYRQDHRQDRRHHRYHGPSLQHNQNQQYRRRRGPRSRRDHRQDLQHQSNNNVTFNVNLHTGPPEPPRPPTESSASARQSTSAGPSGLSNQQQWRETTTRPLANEFQQSHLPGGSTDVLARDRTAQRELQRRRDPQRDLRDHPLPGPSLQHNPNQQSRQQHHRSRGGQLRGLQSETVDRISGTSETTGRVFNIDDVFKSMDSIFPE
ncbi:hypothetical protein ANANG_G00274600 [Anguilla anguilla]|uniref:Uncharacterized protein n=1 Tax=Anguilla anguilla TaxID=7936 RepID=A0A9D3LML1_ANGAN|nr:hypothetical protein ANANG_G00274600 [Anguilla anguilla]